MAYEPNTLSKVFQAVYDSNGSLAAAPSTAYETIKAVYEDDGTGKGRLRITTTGSTGTDYYVTGQTLNGTNLILSLNNGDTITTDVSSLGPTGTTNYYVTGQTLNVDSLETTLNNGDSFTTDLSSLNTDTNYFVTGQTLNGTALETELNNGDSLSTELSSLNTDTNYYVTGQTLNTNTLETTLNDGSQIDTDLSSLNTDTNYYVTGQTLNSTTLETTLNDGTQIDTDLSSINTDTNYYVTGQTLNANTLETTLNDGSQLDTDLSSLATVTGATNGLTLTDKNVELGGSLDAETTIDLNSKALNINDGSTTAVEFTDSTIGMGIDDASTSSTETILAASINLTVSAATGDESVFDVTTDYVKVSELNITNMGTGTSINNLGIDASGNVVTGTDVGGTDYYVTGQTLNGTALETELNNGDSLSTELSSLNTDTNYYVTGQTLSGGNLKTTLNNGNTLSTNIGTYSGFTESQVDFMIAPTTGVTYNIIPNNFYAADVESMNIYTDAGTLNITVSNDSDIFGGFDSKAITATGTTATVTSANTLSVSSKLSFTVDTIVTAAYLYGSIKLV